MVSVTQSSFSVSIQHNQYEITFFSFPDVMMPAYAKSRWSVLFFITYLAIVLYFFMNLVLVLIFYFNYYFPQMNLVPLIFNALFFFLLIDVGSRL